MGIGGQQDDYRDLRDEIGRKEGRMEGRGTGIEEWKSKEGRIKKNNLKKENKQGQRRRKFFKKQ